ncbi:E3 ubiquitin-protein ligase RBBP6 isoform X2 [Episyrphus balteatus]|uniref:E3 ubiquitin-protein ligase RBBP6 isoform X2 n=1 Tax=Episyrphus balteatus TaxID=286459 RepID=UPI002486C182|nr:E3 ubiquitin-protein ligase RBBP6 isoform X2 [Episyrphus balteatus]
MSVNGDLMVVRNGRSTSQVSVYNYPEHLNPFYEDDNHKRLRFWQINKSSKDGQGRRNSFSLGGLKDMWAFKSFRLKKKSSSLGINKTSESPPPLRRDVFNNNNNGYNTYDPRMRYTTGATNGTLGTNNAFQRNVPYRSSLQDMRNTQSDLPTNGIGFNRNDRYRSTIQPATTSGTPTQTLTLPTSRRSSQISVASTNPFDDEDDDDVVMGGVSASSTPAKHPARKKRRAPPPPIPVHQIIKEESSSAGSTPSHKPSTTQPKNSNEEERLEIHNLTAEIESFVKSSNTDSPENHEARSSSVVVTSNSLKQNGTIPKTYNSPSTRESDTSITSNVDIIITPNEESLFIREDQDIEVSKKEDSSVKLERNKVEEIGHVETIHIRTESPRSTPERKESPGVSTFRSETKPSSSEKVINTTNESVVKVHEVTIKETTEKSRPPIAAKPNIPKSPPPVSPRLSTSRREILLAETPDTPAMRRKEIKTVEEVSSSASSSSPEMPHREVGIDVGPLKEPAPQRHEVTIKVQHVLAINEDTKQEPVLDSTPIPAVRGQKQQSTEQNSPLPAVRKVTIIEKDPNVSNQAKSSATFKEEIKTQAKSSPTSKEEIKTQENASNLEEDLPTTISELQLIISEIEQVAERIEESATENPQEPDSLPKPVVALTSPNDEIAHPAPIQKPPRAKHFTEDINENIYRPRPSQWKQSTLAPLEPVPPEKRRSVKQIIDSINRSQQLLGGAKKEEETEIDANNPQRNQSETNTNAMEQNLKSLAESQREMKRMLLELEGLENAHEQKLSNKTDENFQGILDTIVSTLAKETDKNGNGNGNGDVFKKCTITKEVNNASRESSPTSSNLDWNPLPKPKRTNKNLSPELQVKRNNNNNKNN